MFKNKKAFTILEIIMVVVISSVILVMIAPALTKQKKYRPMTEKVVCIPGKRIVIANSLKSGALNGEFKLPPGINTFYLTLTGGGAGGFSTCYFMPRDKGPGEAQEPTYNKYLSSRAHKVCNDAGGGGNGANFLYRKKVDLSTDVTPDTQLRIKYSIGNGGAKGVSGIVASDQGYSALQAGSKDELYDWTTGGNGDESRIRIYKNDTSSLIDSLTTSGGKSAATGVRRGVKNGNDCRSGDSNQCVGAIPPLNFYSSLFDETDENGNHPQALTINVNYATSNSGDSEAIKGQRGEPSSIFYPGLGGGSAFGIGSYGSGGHGGLDTRAKSYDYVKGEPFNRRNGEHGMGGIMIIEYESKCQTAKKE